MDARQKAWITGLVGGIVTQPNEVTVYRGIGSSNAEIMIQVAPEDEHFFTDDVLSMLTGVLFRVIGFAKPIIYLAGTSGVEGKSIDRSYRRV